MSWGHGGGGRGGRGGGRGGGGGWRGGGGGGFRGRGRDNFRSNRGNWQRDEGPPDTVVESGAFMHPCEGEMVYKMTAVAQVPKFNAPVYLENKTQIGKVEEVLGPISEVFFSVKPTEGVLPQSFKAGDKVYLAPDKLMPLQRFTDPAPNRGGIGKARGGRGGARGRGGQQSRGRGGRGRGGHGRSFGRGGQTSGGFGGGRGGRGNGRGGFRGGFRGGWR